jgi:hypothetical protein
VSNANPPTANRARWPGLLVIALASLVPIACGSGPEMATVTGRVSYQGKPLPKGTITFVAVNANGRNASGQIDAEGYYTLQTEQPGDGVLLGGYDVTISARDDAVLDYIPKEPVKPKRLAPEKYENPGTSGLKRAVTSGRNTINFELTD